MLSVPDTLSAGLGNGTAVGKKRRRMASHQVALVAAARVVFSAEPSPCRSACAQLCRRRMRCARPPSALALPLFPSRPTSSRIHFLGGALIARVVSCTLIPVHACRDCTMLPSNTIASYSRDSAAGLPAESMAILRIVPSVMHHISAICFAISPPSSRGHSSESARVVRR